MRELLEEDNSSYSQDLPDPQSPISPVLIVHEIAKKSEVPDDALSLLEAERRLIVETLSRYNGNKTHAAQHLGIKWAALDRRCKKLGIAVK